MAKQLSITVHPAALSGEYLTVTDAMRQVLDIVEALEQSEAAEGGARQIVWRLTEAHTNSPPFTAVIEPYPAHPSISVAMEAARLTDNFIGDFRRLLSGQPPEVLPPEASKRLRRVLERNLNGVGQTDIQSDGQESIAVVPQTAKAGVVALDRIKVEEEAARVDWSRTEYGSVEGLVEGLTKWNSRPAVVVIDRLSGEKFVAVLSTQLVEKIGSAHTWLEVWADRRVLLTGALHYNSDSVLKRADLDDLVGLDWTAVELSDARKVDILQGRSVRDHIEAIRGEDLG